MLRAFHPFDLLGLEDLVARFTAEAPAFHGLQDALFAAPERILVSATDGNPDGFIFLPGDAIRTLGGLYATEHAKREALLRETIIPLQASGTLALMAPDHLGHFHLGPVLQDLGFMKIERLDMVQDQSRVVPAPLDVPEGFCLIDWDASRLHEAARLLASTNQGTIDGLFLCHPDAPSPEACLARLKTLEAGDFGPFLPDVSAMILQEMELVGLLLVTQSGPDEAFLFELTLSRDVQGQGLAPLLIRRIQEKTRSRGLRRVRFMWCERNRAVRRLFPPETIGEARREPWWIWLSEAYRTLRARKPTG